MASSLPLSSNTKITTYAIAPSLPQIFPNKSQISLVRNLRGSCKATTINSDQNPNHDPQTCLVKLERRNLLLGLGGLALATHNITRPANAAETSKKVVLVESSDLPIALDSVVSVIVPRPRRSRSKKDKEEEEEVLAIEGIEFVADKVLKFDVHVNDDENSLCRPDKSEFAGSLVFLPQSKKKVKTSLHLGISALLEDLGADDDGSIKVTLVPRNVQRPVTVGRIKIDYFA
ncbi:hypothetical protein FF1_004997 [Malus domestica]|uniref:Polyphenol oxidase C-terminal domain-containing protein n=1 Tax=Malus domestica TaxID=3750 RepID=A0A498ISD2_MALDO|nr:polyphenol oxidase latent form, chloroplastic-like [Malus sylvestris]RXH86129.1 hypothetical protein DVH24_017182 [Malus domestica]